MKTPVLLVFPIAAELFLYASGIPIQHNRYNGFPIDSALIQRSGPNDLNGPPKTLSVNRLLNPVQDDQYLQHSSSTQPSAQGVPSGGHGTPLPPISILLHPGLSSNNPPSSTDNSHGHQPPQAHGGDNPSPSPASSITLRNPSSSNQRFQRPGANSQAQHMTPFAQPQPQAQNSGVHQSHSSAPGGTSTPNVLRMPENAENLTASEFADKLKRQAQRLQISEEEKLVEIMELMPRGFESALVKQKPTTLDSLNSLTDTWHAEMEVLCQEQPKSTLVQKNYLLRQSQIKAISWLHREYNVQKAWDEYWVDNSINAKLTTTYLSKTRILEADHPLPQLAVLVSSLSKGDLEKLESKHGNTPQALVAMAEELEKQPDENRTHNALVLRRKAIQMAVMNGLGKTYFVAQQEKLRNIVPDSDFTNMARAEMAIISLQRFWSHVANRE